MIVRMREVIAENAELESVLAISDVVRISRSVTMSLTIPFGIYIYFINTKNFICIKYIQTNVQQFFCRTIMKYT